MSETENIGKMAELVSDELMSYFKWEKVDLTNTNFDCKKPKEHSKSGKAESYTHPVDVVFHYLDPYTNKRVLLNTDLKSYVAGSITYRTVSSALKSLANTIDCAKISKQWSERFNNNDGPSEIRGLLFTYNHDGEFDKDFYNRFFRKTKSDDPKKKIINTASLGLKKGQLIHIIEPLQIVYLNTIVNDLHGLVSKRKLAHLDENKYWFYYPETHLHKTHFNKYERAATIEMLSSPFLIIGYDEVIGSKGVVAEEAGYIVYYNGPGDNTQEFVYLLDTFSKNQMLDSPYKIKIRCTSATKNADIISVFKNACREYANAWGFDEFKSKRLQEIEDNFELVTQIRERLSDINVGWRKS